MRFCIADIGLGRTQCDFPGHTMDVGFAPGLSRRLNPLQSFVDVTPCLVELT
jgi:hypothetical protein